MNDFWKFCAYAMSGIGVLTTVLTFCVIFGQIKFAL